VDAVGFADAGFVFPFFLLTLGRPVKEGEGTRLLAET
jgi:hypothetical protein